MSMNLHCKETELSVQTPTYITDIIYNRYSLTKDGVLVVKPDNWVSIRERYIDYFLLLMEQEYNSINYRDDLNEEEKQEERKFINCHRKETINHLRSYKKLTFFVM